MRDGWESQACHWAAFARTPGHDSSHDHTNLPALLELRPAPGRRTLDLGCGEGRLGRFLQSLGHRVTGVDAAPTMVRLAASHDGAAPAVIGDAAALPFADEAFDLVVAYMCLHDMDRMTDAVAEASRVLERGGRLCLAIPHPVNSAGSFEGRDAGAPFVIGGSYLAPRPADWSASRGGVQLTFHSEHRPLQAYSRALEAAGLLIEAIREPAAPDQVVRDDPGCYRWQRIPLFLHMRAVRVLPPGGLGLPGLEGNAPVLAVLAVDVQGPAVAAARVQVQHDVEDHRHVDLAAGQHLRWPAGLEAAFDLDGQVVLRTRLVDAVAVFVDEPQQEGDLLAGLPPRHVEQRHHRARYRARCAGRPAAAGNEQLAVRDLGVIGKHHRGPHGRRSIMGSSLARVRPVPSREQPGCYRADFAEATRRLRSPSAAAE
jgi:SAM-dependent methyltransferase